MFILAFHAARISPYPGASTTQEMGTKTEHHRENSPELTDVWMADALLAKAFAEQVRCMQAVYAQADEVLRPMPGAPAAFDVRMGEIPASFFTPRRNVFSTLFQSTYRALGVPLPRRLLYGVINHLFRIWVTGADNLLDDEDKCVLPLRMPQASRVMREVVAIMAADRVLGRLLAQAVADGTLTPAQAAALSDATLRRLLPSAAQEAGEEDGVDERADPAYVLETIHLLKTGMLFNIPFTGFDLVESEVDAEKAARLKAALRAFGGGCQILDDVRDLARDFVERRHNYVISVLARDRPSALAAWAQRPLKVTDRLYGEVAAESFAAARLGLRRLAEACATFQAEGVISATGASPAAMARAMLSLLDLEDLADEDGI